MACVILPGPTGKANKISLHCCVSSNTCLQFTNMP
uniref:Uncharacterized protein n=1 Tax=Setaria italica TaxID=4555 RepID=K3XU92_SETIT